MAKKPIDFQWAQELFLHKYLGADAIEAVFGFRPPVPQLPDYWSEETLIRYAELGYILIYNPDRLPDGSQFGLGEMTTRFFAEDGNIVSRTGSGRIRDRLMSSHQFRRNGSIKPSACFLKSPNITSIRAGWQLVSPLTAYETHEMNQVDRIDWLVENMWRMVPSGPHHNECAAAAREWAEVRKECGPLMCEKRYPEVAVRLSQLQLNRFILEPVANTVFRYLLYFKQTGRKLFCPSPSYSCNYTDEGRVIKFGGGRGQDDFGWSASHTTGAMIFCTGIEGCTYAVGSVVSRMNF